MLNWRKFGVIWLWLAMGLGNVVWAESTANSELKKEMQRWSQLSVLMLGQDGQPMVSRDANVARIPASTTKLFTAYLALRHWGAKHRFKTEFYLQKQGKNQGILWVKGSGDPFLVSEELALISQVLVPKLREQGIEQLSEIRLDVSVFEPEVQLPGSSGSDNPYDAIPSALAVNFNTLNMRWQNGEWRSAEEQTPLTPLAIELAQLSKSEIQKNGRINIGQFPKQSQRYFAELLSAFMSLEGLSINNKVVWQSIPSGVTQVYVHENSRTLAEMIRPMMKYSTNFIANQLVLMLASETYRKPASQELVKQLMNEAIRRFGWQNAYLEDGAGLSRNNRLSSTQLVELLKVFRPWQALLPEVVDDVYAKSGSLIGVSALAGYIGQGAEAKPFALILNERGPYRYRNRLAKLLKETALSQ